MTRGIPTAADSEEVRNFPITHSLEIIETFEQGRVLTNGECLCLKALAKRFKELAETERAAAELAGQVLAL